MRVSLEIKSWMGYKKKKVKYRQKSPRRSRFRSILQRADVVFWASSIHNRTQIVDKQKMFQIFQKQRAGTTSFLRIEEPPRRKEKQQGFELWK